MVRLYSLKASFVLQANAVGFYSVSHKKNTPNIFSCNLNKHFLISILFSTNITQSLGCWNVVYFPTSPKQCFCTTLQNRQTQK